METYRIECGDRRYPRVLHERLGDAVPSCLHAVGDTAILANGLLGLICSIKCPGSVVLKTYDAVRALREAKVAMIGGFHSPMENDCLDILLRGGQPVILCAAKGLSHLRIGPTPRQALKDGRLLVLSSFAQTVRRTTVEQAVGRNDLVAALSAALLVPHAAPGGKTWTTVRHALARQQPVFTFATDDNRTLVEAGAFPFAQLHFADLLGEGPS